MNTFARCALLMLLAGPALPPGARAASLSVDAGLSTLFGDTTYAISGHVEDPELGIVGWESDLEFDLDATLLDLGVCAEFPDQRMSVALKGSWSLATRDGTLRDRDWIMNPYLNTYYGPLMGDTDSDIESDVGMLELRLTWDMPRRRFRGGTRVRLHAGARYQDWGTFEATGYEGVYSGLLSETGEAVPVSGDPGRTVITYEVQYAMLFLGADMSFPVAERLRLTAGLDAGPALAEDRDEHLLRDQASEAETTGLGLSARLEAEWIVSPSARLRIFATHTYIDTDGTQAQYALEHDPSGNRVIAGVIDVIDDEISTRQTVFGVAGAWMFGEGK